MNRLLDAVRRQFERNWSRNLLHKHSEWMLEVDSSFIAAMEELLAGEHASHGVEIERLASEAALAFVDRIYEINQYLQVGKEDHESLKQIYLQSWASLRETKDIEATLRTAHYPKIKAFVESLYPKGIRDQLREAVVLNEVANAEYTAGLQMTLYRLNVEELREPVLDIGCGAHANLVEYLHSSGVEAFGVDRKLAVSSSYLIEANWFDFPLEQMKWGTVVSNLAFTNHLKYAETYDRTAVGHYERRFAEILGSLAIGGSFIYSPSAGGLEVEVPREKYHMRKWAISSTHHACRIRRIAP